MSDLIQQPERFDGQESLHHRFQAGVLFVIQGYQRAGKAQGGGSIDRIAAAQALAAVTTRCW